MSADCVQFREFLNSVETCPSGGRFSVEEGLLDELRKHFISEKCEVCRRLWYELTMRIRELHLADERYAALLSVAFPAPGEWDDQMFDTGSLVRRVN